MKYKVGDKVRVITDLHKGLIGKITEVDDSSSVPYKVTFYESKINDNWYCWYFEKSLEPVQEKSTDFSKNSAIIEYQGKKYDIYQKTDYRYTDGTHNLSLLLKEHKEEILDEKEKEYLRNVIKYVIEPTKVKILNIIKDFSNGYYYITIRYYSKKLQIMNYVTLPAFTDKRMYKDMKLNKAYTLEELGL